LKTINKILVTGLIGLASLLPVKSLEAQINGNVEYILSEKLDNSYARLNFFYGDIKKIKGFSFLELYHGQKGYFGKTSLEKQIIPRVNAIAQPTYISEPLTKTGLGTSINAIKTKNKSFLNLQVLPVWISKKFKKNKNEFVLGYSAKVNLPRDFFLFGFGQMNIANKEGPTWNYGELTAGKNIKKWSFGYNPALINRGQGKAIPKMEHRAYVSAKF